jgi:polar amino acid transport system substrate-binding protein
MATMLRLSILVLACLLVLPACSLTAETIPDEASSGDTLTAYTEQLPPYSYLDNGTLKGFTVDILGEISAMAGNNLSRERIQVLPWDEGYQAALNGNRTVIFSTARVPERESSFQWVGPISTERYVLFATNDSGIRVNRSEDLRGLKIGVIADDASSSLLQAEGVSTDQLVFGENVTDLITRLRKNTIDLWCYPEITGRYYAAQVTGNYDAFSIVQTLNEVGIYYAFSRDVPETDIRAYQAALDELKQEKNGSVSRYQEILRQYIPDTGSVPGT